MEIEAKLVMELRKRTDLPMMQCKKALIETGGDLAKAEEWLAKQGAKIAEKKAGRETREGTIGVYLHHDRRVASMVEVNCETAQVANTEDFLALAKDLALHIAFAVPAGVDRDDVSEELVARERDIILGQLETDEKMAGKPDEVKQKIAEGKLNKFYSERVLLEQPFAKDDKITVKERIEQAVLKVRENITIGRFSYMKVGE